MTIADVASSLGARVLHGAQNVDAFSVAHVEVATKQVTDLISVLQDKRDTLIVTAATRADVLLSIILAAQSTSVPLHPGVLLTGAADLPESVKKVRARGRGLMPSESFETSF